MWCKEYTAVAGLVGMEGERVIKLIKRLEDDKVEVSGGFIRGCFEGLVVPEDVSTVLGKLEMHKGKLTASMVRELCSLTKEERSWRWVILHPALRPLHVHPSRRVCTSGFKYLLH